MKNKEITMLELYIMVANDTAPDQIEYKREIYTYYYGDYININHLSVRSAIDCIGYDIKKILRTKIKILSKVENDEWEDIKEIEQIISSKAIYDNYEDITKDIHNIVETIDNLVISFNQLIKNQKYLKERLDKDE